MQIMTHGRGLYAWVTSVALAQSGHNVTLVCCTEPDDEVRLEPKLLERAQVLQAESQMTVVASLPDALPAVHFLGLASGGVEALHQRAKAIVENTLLDVALVVLNTTPVGTLDALQAELEVMAQGRSVTVLALPLFVRSGRALADFSEPPLLLIGEPYAGAADELLDWLRPYSRQALDTLPVPLAAAELTKFAINAMLATRISLMNELAGLAGRMQVDIELVRQGMAADPRIGPDYLQPGCGFGGPSFTDELFKFAESLREAGGQPGVLDAVLRINAEQREKPFRQLWRHYEGQLSGRRVALWGVAFKPGAASVEHSSVHALLSALLAQGVGVVVHDPKAVPALLAQYPEAAITVAESPLAAAMGADAVLLLTAWPVYHNPDYAALRAAMRQPVIIDGRNVFEPEMMEQAGFVYYGVGRGRA